MADAGTIYISVKNNVTEVKSLKTLRTTIQDLKKKPTTVISFVPKILDTTSVKSTGILHSSKSNLILQNFYSTTSLRMYSNKLKVNPLLSVGNYFGG